MTNNTHDSLLEKVVENKSKQDRDAVFFYMQTKGIGRFYRGLGPNLLFAADNLNAEDQAKYRRGKALYEEIEIQYAGISVNDLPQVDLSDERRRELRALVYDYSRPNVLGFSNCRSLIVRTVKRVKDEGLDIDRYAKENRVNRQMDRICAFFGTCVATVVTEVYSTRKIEVFYEITLCEEEAFRLDRFNKLCEAFVSGGLLNSLASFCCKTIPTID